jgi:lysophospholipase L1-like esterase
MYFLLRKNHEKRKNILTSVTSVIITLFVAEIILRLMGYNATYFEIRESYYKSIYESNAIRDYHTHIENSTHYLQAKEYSYNRKTNSLGLSDEELKLDTTKQLIIALGDSFTEGDGAHSDSTWIKFLEREYNSNEKHNYKFFNAGVCGSDPFYEYRLLKDKLIEYQPEIVIVGYGYDLNDIVIRGGMERFGNYDIVLKEHWWEVIYKHSFTFRLFIRNILGYNDLLLTEDEYTTEKDRALKQLIESIDLFSELSKENGFELLIVFYPQKKELAKGKFHSNYILIEYCKKNKIHNLDLLAYYKNDLTIREEDIEDYYWKIDGHHNARGYEIFAKGVYSKLKEMGY